MSTATQVFSPYTFAGITRRERRGSARAARLAPWAHPGVASERARRAEEAYAAELAHAEHAARTRSSSIGSAR
jgi:hypothetical protein